MTTIAATTEMMAADTQITEGRKHNYHLRKIYRVGNSIVGAAGDSRACDAFVLWWKNRQKERFVLPRGTSFSALVLQGGQIFRFDDTELIQVVTADVAAIGSGKVAAFAAMETMKKLGQKPDPRVAVCVAIKTDAYTGGQVEWMRATKRRSK